MPTFTVTIPEAQVTPVEEAFCVPEGLPVNAANAKAILRKLVEKRVTDFQFRKKQEEVTVPSAPEGITVT